VNETGVPPGRSLPVGFVKVKIPVEESKAQFRAPGVRPVTVVQTGVSDVIIHYYDDD
jgi:hypothetical protein